MHRSSLRSLVAVVLLTNAVALGACAPSSEEDEGVSSTHDELAGSIRMDRYTRIRDVAATRGITSRAYMLAGIAYAETGLAQCWSEATWACQGPSSPECGGGPVIAGASDGACWTRQGGLGMFQFDAGNYDQTLRTYGHGLLTFDGQIRAAVDFVVQMVKRSAYTTNAETDEKARAWVERFDPTNGGLRDQWIKTVLRYYNGCPPGGSCWAPRYRMYNDALSQVLAETRGVGFWTAGTTCPGGSGVVIGEIQAKYLSLGGCGSFLGRPVTNEHGTPDGVGRYSVFEHGSIYWTPKLGAHEVHGVIRDKWRDVGWEAGILGYPITDETPTPDGIGRYNVFERGSIYWTEELGAHEVHGRIRDKWKELGWEAGVLGYPVSDEYAVEGGRRSDFQNGSITWLEATDDFIVTPASDGKGERDVETR